MEKKDKSQLEQHQKNLFIIKTSVAIGAIMFLGFAYLAMNLMSL